MCSSVHASYICEQLCSRLWPLLCWPRTQVVLKLAVLLLLPLECHGITDVWNRDATFLSLFCLFLDRVSLYNPDWPWPQRSVCFYLLSAEIKYMQHPPGSAPFLWPCLAGVMMLCLHLACCAHSCLLSDWSQIQFISVVRLVLSNSTIKRLPALCVDSTQ